ncbi:protein FAM227A-like [Clupea harengus]|uniref:Protein FAM227A-like n=1 Tax=Clupea harengus TaxID=7950 RepID=A0A8M1K5I4_CLUHA|nr:protein FAM227A-like [Clupea harengus]
MAEINAVCAPMVVHQEDVNENVSAQRKRQNMQKESLEPVSCLIGSMSELSERISSLILLPKMVYTDTQLSRCDRHSSQQESPPPPQSSQSRSNASTEKHEGGRPKLVELCQYPGFSEEGLTPLPHHTSFSTVVARVVRAQPRLSHKPRYKAAFQSILSSGLMEHFVTDVFWWLFLQNFQPDGHVQDCLFSRIAENYIRILSQNQSSRIGNVFLREFPHTLSQTLYSAFCCCFPQSCITIRSGTFPQTLCSTAYQWTGGICPAPNVFRKWDIEALEPDEDSNAEFVAENEKKETESCLSLLECMLPGACASTQRDCPPSTLTATWRPMSPVAEPSHTSFEGSFSNAKEQTINNLSEKEGKSTGSEDIKGSDQKAATDHRNRKSTKESQTGWYELEFHRCVFNVWGNSPLVRHYMENLKMEPKVGQDVLVRRTQIHTLPPEDAVTYRQFVRQCHERSAARWHNLRAMRAQCEQDMAALQRSKDVHRRILLKEQKRILSQRSSVKLFCQKLCPDATTEEEANLLSDSSYTQ